MTVTNMDMEQYAKARENGDPVTPVTEEPAEDDKPVEDPSPSIEPGEEPAEEIVEDVDEELPEEPIIEESPSEDPVVKAKKGTSPKAQKRIDRLTKEKYELQEQLAYLKGKSEGTPKEEPLEPSEPAIDNYDSYEEYEAALIDYRVDQKVDARFDAFQKKEDERKSVSKETQARSDFDDRSMEVIESAKKNHPDLDDVWDDGTPLTATMAEAMHGTDGELLYHFAKNPLEAERISKLSPIKQVKEMTLLENTIKSAKKGTKPKKLSTAPPPLTEVGGAGAPSDGYSKMNNKEFMEERAKKHQNERGL